MLLELLVAQSRFHPLLQKFVDLFRRTANKTPRIEEQVQLRFYTVEIGIILDALDKIIFAALFLDDPSGLVR